MRAFLADLAPWCIRAIGAGMVTSAIVASAMLTLVSCMRQLSPQIPTSARAVSAEEQGAACRGPSRPAVTSPTSSTGAGGR